MVEIMNDYQPTVLCVDDEENILNSLKRLLRGEGYRLLTASSGAEGLKILNENDVHLVICDQRMPEMSGTEFLARVKKIYTDIIRIVLTGYTDVDSITESINKGHIYKFFLKPWNDQSLKLEIRQALEQYRLMQDNKILHERIVKQNEELKQINGNLEIMVKERTRKIEIQNQALELSSAILEDLPIPIIGIGEEGMIVMINRQAQSIKGNSKDIEIGKSILNYFPNELQERVKNVLETNKSLTLERCSFYGATYGISFIPLSGRSCRKGIILTLRSERYEGTKCLHYEGLAGMKCKTRNNQMVP